VANIKSQIKRNKQNEKRRMRNKAVKSSLKTAVRKFNETLATSELTGEASHTETVKLEGHQIEISVSKSK